jgi:hypothetical protein
MASQRSASGRRRYTRADLRRLAFIRAAQTLGLSLEEIRAALASLPEGRTPTKADWEQLSRGWKALLDAHRGHDAAARPPGQLHRLRLPVAQEPRCTTPTTRPRCAAPARATCWARRRHPPPRRRAADHAARRQSTICSRAARQAGMKPPTKPMASAKTRVCTTMRASA